jgi:hypothetical protein
MTEVQKFRTKPRRVEALQIRLGETTLSQILAFCPKANVGVGSTHTARGPERDELDLRWVQVPVGPAFTFVDAQDHDWIVWEGAFHYVHSDLEVARLFEEDPDAP